MLTFPCAKINLGLNIVEKREDGYHNLETVFYPIPITDALEIKTMHHDFPIDTDCDLKVSGINVEGNEADNLVVKAYNLVAKHYDVSRIHIHLHKGIPTGAGLGGGSSDAAYMIRMLDDYCHIHMGIRKMEGLAAKLGADCAFFISAEPAFATGIGDVLQPIAADEDCNNYLEGYWLALVKPQVSVSTKEAYANITPKKPAKCCRDVVLQPISTWKDELINDFEEPVFKLHPELAEIKQKLYDMGAEYAAMSGSGSSLFGIFREKPENVDSLFPDCITHTVIL